RAVTALPRAKKHVEPSNATPGSVRVDAVQLESVQDIRLFRLVALLISQVLDLLAEHDPRARQAQQRRFCFAALCTLGHAHAHHRVILEVDRVAHLSHSTNATRLIAPSHCSPLREMRHCTCLPTRRETPRAIGQIYDSCGS